MSVFLTSPEGGGDLRFVNLSVRTVTVWRPSEVEDQPESLRGLGIQVVAGDVVTVKLPKNLGCTVS